ncbi:SDR family NAD(P)-dependent oxidoreductase, partial [Streptomyces sp. V4-01]|nr:SDR family NAD(P)-dependent oxidoreductase [Streptomyces sp. V4-01]
TMDAAATAGALVTGTLRRDEDSTVRFLASAAEWWAHGAPVDWSATPAVAAATAAAAAVDLPSYPFQRRRYWLEPRPVPAPAPAPLDALRYRVAWQPVETAAGAVTRDGWVLVVPERYATPGTARWAELLRDELTARGAAVRVVTVAGGTPEAQARALDEGLDAPPRPAGGPPLGRVVSLLSAGAGFADGSGVLPWGVTATLELLRAVDRHGGAGAVWCATRGAVSVDAVDAGAAPDALGSDADAVSGAGAGGEHDPDPYQAMVWGLGRVAAAEYPRAWGGLLDLPAEPGREAARLAVDVLLGGVTEQEVAIRGSGVRGRRLVRAPLAGRPPVRDWRPTGTVLITGGTGALGRHVARHLARAGAPHLLLLSRSGREAPEAARTEEELTALGARVTFAACDVADRGAVAAVLGGLPEELPLTAVVHAAGYLDDAPLGSLTAGQLDGVLRVKAGGALVLDELTRDLDLSAFVLFSSVAGLSGIAGQGGYAPGNAFLDALAVRRRAAGRPATAIAWGHWAGEGIAAPDVEARLRAQGVLSLRPDLAVRALAQILDHDETSVAVLDCDWNAPSWPPALVGGLAGPRPAAPPAGPAGPGAEDGAAEPGADLRRALAAVPSTRHRDTLLEQLRPVIAAVLRHPSPELITPEQKFKDLGFDSLTSVELRNALERRTGLRLTATLVFDHPTPGALADHLLGSLAPQAGADLLLAELDRLALLLADAAATGPDRGAVGERLKRLLAGWQAAAGPAPGAPATSDIETATDDELIGLLAAEFDIYGPDGPGQGHSHE